MLEACFLPDATAEALIDPALPWTEIVPNAKLQPHNRHRFVAQPGMPATHVRLNIYPDGGVARLRLFGRQG
jgi:allantoicase